MRPTLVLALSLALAASVTAAPPTVSVINADGRSTLTLSYDAASVTDPPPPGVPVAAWEGIDADLLISQFPRRIQTSEHGSVGVLEPTSGAVAVISAGVRREWLKAGLAPPSLPRGVQIKLIEKLSEEYDDYQRAARAAAALDPASTIQLLVADTPSP